MKRKVVAVTLILLLILMGIPLDFAVKYKTATVVEVTGMVSILKAGGEKAFTPKVDTILEHGDRIITGKGASLSLQIDKDKYIKVGEKTYMSLSELMSEAESGGDSTNIKLFTGKVWASLSKPLGGSDSFEIETPTAVMGAKGTKFYVKYVISPTKEEKESSTTELVVLEGQVGMKTQVPGKGDGGQPSQEVELTAGANETLVLDPKLVQGISDEIESLLQSGQKIEEIKIQEVVAKVATAKKVEVKNLDLFVLEIVADEPEAFDPSITDGLDQLIEQKKQELPEEEGFDETIGDINYEELADPTDPDQTEAPAIPALPTTPTEPTEPNTPDTGGASGDDVIVTPLGITKIEVLDATGDDGIADHVLITFNKAVDDSTYDASSGAYIESSGALGTLVTSSISYDEIGKTNVTNDSTIVLNIDTTGKSVNTVPIAYFNVPHAGMIKSTTGESLGTVSNFLTSDRVAPVLLGAMVSFEGSAQNKYIKLVYSEPLSNPSPNIWNNIRVAESSETLYNSAQVIGFEATSSSTVYMEAKKLDYPTLRYFKNAVIDGYTNVRLKMNPQVVSSVTDIYGNQRSLTDDISILGYAMDTQKTMVTDVTVETLEAGTEYYFTVKLDDYLTAEDFASIVSNPQVLLQGTFYNASADFIDIQYLFATTDQIQINFHVTVFSGTLYDNDAITINYNYLYDMFGYPVKDYYDASEQSTRTYRYESSGDTWTMNTTPASGFYASSAATLDVDGDGIVDHLQVTFNNPVDDSSFVGSNGITLQSGDVLDPVMDTQIVTNLTGEYVDTPDDAIIYLQLDHTGRQNVYNTGVIGTLTIPASTIQNLDGVWNDVVTNMTTLDHAAPIIYSAFYYINGDSIDKSIKFFASEPILETDTVFFAGVALNNSDASDFASSSLISASDGTTSKASLLLTLDMISSNLVNIIESNISNSLETYAYFSDSSTLTDGSGNTRNLQGTHVLLTGTGQDTAPAHVKTITIGTPTGYKYPLTITFSDYLDSQSVNNYISALSDAIVYQNGNCTLESSNYMGTSYDSITLSTVLSLDAPLSTSDMIMVNLSGLLDYAGLQTIVNNEGVDRTSFYIEYTTDWGIDSPYMTLLEANTLDSNENGKIDLIELVFNGAVNDSSFQDVSATITSDSIGTGNVDTSILSSTAPHDLPNDDTIYFNVSELDGYNTGALGTLDIPASGMVAGITGKTLNTVSSFALTDQSGPILVDSELDLSLPFDEKYISLTFSELLDESDVIDINTLKLLGTGAYASGPFNLSGSVSVSGSQILIKPLTLGTSTDTSPSFISTLSKYLYGMNDTQIRLVDGFAVHSLNSESYTLPIETAYPYDVSLSSVQRVNNSASIASVTVTSSSSIVVTYDDYIETYNHYFSGYQPATITVYQGSLVLQGQAVESDHKSIKFDFTSDFQSGDIIGISNVRNITNSYGDDNMESPITAGSMMFYFDGTNWGPAN